MNIQQNETERLNEHSLLGLDAYSADGQYIGTVGGYLPVAPDDEQGIETGVFDTIAPDGRLIGERHIVIDGHGTAFQSMAVVPADQLQIDLRGRRVTVPLTLAQLESLPKRDPDR